MVSVLLFFLCWAFLKGFDLKGLCNFRFWGIITKSSSGSSSRNFGNGIKIDISFFVGFAHMISGERCLGGVIESNVSSGRIFPLNWSSVSTWSAIIR